MNRDKELKNKGYILEDYDIKSNDAAKLKAEEYRSRGHIACVVKNGGKVKGLFDYGVWVKYKINNKI